MRGSMGGMGGMGMSGMGGRMVCVASPINPAVFGAHAETPGVELLQAPAPSSAVLERAGVEIATKLVTELGGDLEAAPRAYPERVLLAKPSREALIRALDERHALSEARPLPSDLKVEISGDELRSLIGREACAAVLTFFGEPYDTIKLRRVEAVGSGQCIAFHTDWSQRTMQIPLNEPSAYSGGGLMFATETGFALPERVAGAPVIHTKNTVHGVTALVSGVRYSLFVCDTRQEEGAVETDADLSPAALESLTTRLDLDYLIEPTLAQFDFFALALPFCERSDDALLSEYVQDYAEFMHAQALLQRGGDGLAGAAAAVDPSFAVEVIWRTHLLHPAAYKEDCGRLLEMCGGGDSSGSGLIDRSCLATAPRRVVESVGGGGPADELIEVVVDSRVDWRAGVDLVAAVRRQQPFMRKMLAWRPELGTRLAVTDGLQSYAQFLTLMRHSPALVPTAIIDLVWHTHQQFPVRYARECRALAGHEVDHDDDDSEEQQAVLDVGWERTRRVFAGAGFGDPAEGLQRSRL